MAALDCCLLLNISAYISVIVLYRIKNPAFLKTNEMALKLKAYKIRGVLWNAYLPPPAVRKHHNSVQSTPYLDDHLHPKHLSFDLYKLKNKNSKCNVQLICGGCTFPVHRRILCARSKVFRDMLQSDKMGGRDGSLKIINMEPNVFKIFVRYLYTAILPELTEDIAIPLYKASAKYGLKPLKKRCGEFCAENLTWQNAFRILVVAEAHNDSDLKDRVVSYMLEEKIPKKRRVAKVL